ncbi:MAG TPA: hypothetical protein VFT74_21505 [Isosphaeraceae bacterium]|nr:hypothetical protein [Isosphaeraceae bacterium]
MTRLSRILLLSLALASVAPASLSACPSCKEAVAAQAPESAKRLTRGYSWSIMLMIAMPMTLFGTGAFLVVRAARKGLLPEL